MTTNEFNIGKVCDLNYLIDLMSHKNHLITGILNAFLKQVPDDLKSINSAIESQNYPIIKCFAHTMKSSVSIMGITILVPLLQEMEELGDKQTDMEQIKYLNRKLNIICSKAIQEVELEKLNYI